MKNEENKVYQSCNIDVVSKSLYGVVIEWRMFHHKEWVRHKNNKVYVNEFKANEAVDQIRASSVNYKNNYEYRLHLLYSC